MNRSTGVLMVAVLVAPAGLSAQGADTLSVERALEVLREHRRIGPVAGLLRQTRGNLSAPEREALADSLVAIALSYQDGDLPERRRVAGSALGALGSAGQPEEGTPFAGSFDALVRVYEETTEAGFKGVVLGAMTRLSDRGRALDFLARVASEPGTSSVTAIRHLANHTGEEGLERLRRVYEEDAVVDGTARGHLVGIAGLHGWGGPLRAVRDRGDGSVASEFLTGSRGGLSAAERSALADSLVAIALTFEPGTLRERMRAATAAVSALASSGHPAPPEGGVPFAGAFDALVRVYEETPYPGLEELVLVGLAELPDRGRVLGFLAEAAASPSRAAYRAVRLLADETGEEGSERLRRLYEENVVVQEFARSELQRIASARGWGGGGAAR